ncbi:MAG: hypothetical protein V8S98_08890 [Lachnospiraceae bacterium]
MTVSAAPLTYNGTEQQPKINASVETGLENVSPDAIFTYSKDDVNYQSEIPGFTEAGTYLVYVKASMANFNDEVKTVAVTVTPKESSSGCMILETIPEVILEITWNQDFRRQQFQ